MQEAVYRVIGVLCAVVGRTPVGTNLGLVHLLWMLVSGRLLGSRGAGIPRPGANRVGGPPPRRAGGAARRGPPPRCGPPPGQPPPPSPPQAPIPRAHHRTSL